MMIEMIGELWELQVKGGEELRTVFVRTLMPSVLATVGRAFKGEL